jgi:hypothetical protein
MEMDDWLKAACADAARRGLPEMSPLLESLARSTVALRDADRAVRTASEAIASAEALDPGAGAGDGPRR